MNKECDMNNPVVQLFDYPITTWEDTDSVVPNSMNNEGPPIRKLFVGNINQRSTYRDLVHLFNAYGKVKHAHVSRNRYSNMKKNYGFVTFYNPEDAAKVLSLQRGELQLHRRILYVAPADSWHQPKELPDGTILWYSKEPKENPMFSEVLEDGNTSASSNSGNDEGAAGISSSPSETPLVESTLEEPQIDKKDDDDDDDDDDEDDDIKEEDCKIRMLNDDCLIHVFSFLSKRERIKIERVCKRWQEVCWKMWRSQRHLDFTSIFLPGSQSYLNTSILTSFLQRCGKNLKSLDLSHKPNDLGYRVTRQIAKHCAQLESLNLSGLPISGASLRSLYPLAKELQILILDGCHGASDKDLQNFFHHCKRLESVILSKHHNLTGKCLMGLVHSPLKHLVLDGCNNLHSSFLVHGLSNLPALINLSLNSCVSLTSSDVSEIVAAVPGLHSLSMGRYFPLFNNSSLQPLSKLNSIIVLDLQLNQVVNDQVMSDIAQGCVNIRKLNITGCSISSLEQPSLTDVGLRCISKLPHLVDLSMSYLANVTDDSLIALAENGRIRKLECRGCPTFTDAGCSRVVASCNELELFDLSGCDVVTETTVKAALEAVKLRLNNIKLLLVIGGSSARHLDKLETHSLLEVDNRDFCIPHLRPDFVDEIYFPSENEDDDDDLCDFDWERHSLLFGDDIEYYEDFFEDDEDEDGCAYAHFGFYI